MRFTLLLSVLPAALVAATSCKTPYGTGVCKSTSSCSTGYHVAGYCPGGADIQCCFNQACSAPQGDGICKSTSKCSGTSVSGYCGGPAGIQCCVDSTSCSTPSGSGTCQSTSSCGGTSIPGYCPGPTGVQCCVQGGGGGGSLPTLDATQSAHANDIIGECKREGLGRQGCLAAITTALTESQIHIYASDVVPESFNYPYDRVGSDHDSVGIFQQRARYYPDIACDMDAACSASQFFSKMVGIANWQTKDVAELCQAVQVSAYPDAYRRYTSQAGQICSAAGL